MCTEPASLNEQFHHGENAHDGESGLLAEGAADGHREGGREQHDARGLGTQLWRPRGVLDARNCFYICAYMVLWGKKSVLRDGYEDWGIRGKSGHCWHSLPLGCLLAILSALRRQSMCLRKQRRPMREKEVARRSARPAMDATASQCTGCAANSHAATRAQRRAPGRPGPGNKPITFSKTCPCKTFLTLNVKNCIFYLFSTLVQPFTKLRELTI